LTLYYYFDLKHFYDQFNKQLTVDTKTAVILQIKYTVLRPILDLSLLPGAQQQPMHLRKVL